jgi:HK97 family phage prohead protease
MPLRKPRADESQSNWMAYCMHELSSESERDRPQEQMVAICLDQWRGRNKTEADMKRVRQVNNEDIDVPEPEEDETNEEFIDRCTDEVMDQDVGEERANSLCALAWENRSGSGRMRHKTHAEIVQGMEFVLSDESPDRVGDIISAAGWDLANFKRNPVALFNHMPSFLIGTWENLRTDKGALRGNLKLAPAGTSERIDEVRKLIEAGILKAVSVGFRPIESRPRTDDAGKKFLGEHFLKQELVETSLVAVPANPNALAVAKSLDISDETLELVFAEHGKENKRKQLIPGKHAVIHSKGKEHDMSLAQRIQDSQARLTALRDELNDHLADVDDSNVSDAQMEKTNDLNERIMREQKHHAALTEAEKHLMTSAASKALIKVPDEPAKGHGNGDGRIAKPYAIVPSPKAPQLPNTKEARMELVVRAGVVSIIAHRQKWNMEVARENIAKNYPRYGDEPTRFFCEYVSKAESAPAMTTVAGWAEELVQQIHGDYLELLHPDSIFPRLAARGLSLQFGRAGRISIPTRARTPSVSGSFVGEGMPIPVRQAAFTAQVLTPKKMAVITTWTREMGESSIPAIEGLLRNAIQEDTAITLDNVLIDDDDADAIRPAGLLSTTAIPIGSGAVAVAPSGTAGFAGIVADLQALTGALLTATMGNIRDMVLLMNPMQTLSISLAAMPGVSAFPFMADIAANRLLTYPILKSGTVPPGTIIAVDAADFVVVGGEAPRFEVSDQATLHMEDTDPQAITGGTPSPAVPVRSLWQTDSLGLRLILPINWCMRRDGMVAGMENITSW